MSRDSLLNLAHVVVCITIPAPMQASIVKANISAFDTLTVVTLLVRLCLNGVTDYSFYSRFINTTIWFNPVSVQVDTFSASSYPECRCLL